MIMKTPKVMCIAKPEPKAWEFNGRSGISYKIGISDGTSNLELPVSSAEVWNKFESFGEYIALVEVSQVANDNRLAARCRIVDCQQA